jgi:hypothetical protein
MRRLNSVVEFPCRARNNFQIREDTAGAQSLDDLAVQGTLPFVFEMVDRETRNDEIERTQHREMLV